MKASAELELVLAYLSTFGLVGPEVRPEGIAGLIHPDTTPRFLPGFSCARIDWMGLPRMRVPDKGCLGWKRKRVKMFGNLKF